MPYPNETEVLHLVGDVKGKTAIVVDDIIDTGGTIVKAVDALIERGAKDVYACCSHPVLSDPLAPIRGLSIERGCCD